MQISYTIRSFNGANETQSIAHESMEYIPDMGFLIKADIVVNMTPNKISISINNVPVREHSHFRDGLTKLTDEIRYAIDKYTSMQTDKLKARMSHLWTGCAIIKNRLDTFSDCLPNDMQARYYKSLLSSLEELNSLELEMSQY